MTVKELIEKLKTEITKDDLQKEVVIDVGERGADAELVELCIEDDILVLVAGGG